MLDSCGFVLMFTGLVLALVAVCSPSGHTVDGTLPANEMKQAEIQQRKRMETLVLMLMVGVVLTATGQRILSRDALQNRPILDLLFLCSITLIIIGLGFFVLSFLYPMGYTVNATMSEEGKHRVAIQVNVVETRDQLQVTGGACVMVGWLTNIVLTTALFVIDLLSDDVCVCASASDSDERLCLTAATAAAHERGKRRRYGAYVKQTVVYDLGRH